MAPSLPNPTPSKDPDTEFYKAALVFSLAVNFSIMFILCIVLLK